MNADRLAQIRDWWEGDQNSLDVMDLLDEVRRLRRVLDDVDDALGGWRRRLDSEHTIDKADVVGLRLHVQTALGWTEGTE